jgi:2-oxoglutarate dehydrogenase E2 component (dihydrolipoamide succinyltransferase)
MPTEYKVPGMGESITEVTIAAWHKQAGEAVALDEHLLDIESEKASFELAAPVAGVVTKVLKKVGDKAAVGETIAVIDETAAPTVAASKPAAAPAKSAAEPVVMPAAQRAAAHAGVSASSVPGTGPGGRVLKDDVQRAAAAPAPAPKTMTTTAPSTPTRATVLVGGDRETEVVPMTTMRQTIARRLVEAQSSAALLTTFNEVDMSAVMALRKKFQDDFTKRYNIKLGFMSFFVKAAVDALQRFPVVNAQVRGNEVIYHNYCDIGIAVGGGKGLIVPVLRNAERLSFSDVELAITDFGNRAKEGGIRMDELTGGTFTISNGGIYGSMLSTPIVNPPQSAILGMHNIVERAVVRDGQIVIRPIMYLALTYDHRLIDGREAVSFLVRIKEGLEDPTRLLVEV